MLPQSAPIFAVVSIGVIGLIVVVPRAGGPRDRHDDRPRPAPRRRHRQPDRPAALRLRRRLRRHGHRRPGGSTPTTSPTPRSRTAIVAADRDGRCSPASSGVPMADPVDRRAMPEAEDSSRRRPRGAPGRGRCRRRSAGEPRRLQVPDGEVVRRVDRFVADRTGLSRSLRPEAHHRGPARRRQGRRLRANSEVSRRAR